jgi:hypothetical protein
MHDFKSCPPLALTDSLYIVPPRFLVVVSLCWLHFNIAFFTLNVGEVDSSKQLDTISSRTWQWSLQFFSSISGRTRTNFSSRGALSSSVQTHTVAKGSSRVHRPRNGSWFSERTELECMIWCHAVKIQFNVATISGRHALLICSHTWWSRFTHVSVISDHTSALSPRKWFDVMLDLKSHTIRTLESQTSCLLLGTNIFPSCLIWCHAWCKSRTIYCLARFRVRV